MYSTSEYYKQAIQKSNPSYLTGTITFKDGSSREFDDTTLALGGVSIAMQSVTQDVLEFGATVLGQLDISLRTDDSESRYKYYGAVIVLSYTIETEQGAETIPLGEFIVAEAEKSKGVMTLCAYDNLFKLDKAYSLQLVGTPYDVMSTLASDCGCELAEDEEYYKALPNGNMTLTVTESSSCVTYRHAAAVIAQMCGCFVQADRSGKLTMRQFKSESNLTLSRAQRYSSTIADYVCRYTGLVVTALAGTFKASSEMNADGLVMEMPDAPAWDNGTESTLQDKTSNLMVYLDTLKYTPGELLIISDPSIDCGDLALVETDTGSVDMLITSYTWKYRNQMELFSVGSNPYLTNKNATTQRVIRDLQVNGTGGGSPTALYTFKNTRKFSCSDKVEPLAGVTFVSTKETFVMFDATFQVDVSVPDVEQKSSIKVVDSNGTSKTYEVPYMRAGQAKVSIQYYYNNNAMMEPYECTLESGSHLITLHYPVNNVEGDSVNRFEVRMSADKRTVTVAKDAFLGTISGQGLAGKPKWDGTITVEEILPKYSVRGVAPFGTLDANVAFRKLKRNDPTRFRDRLGRMDVIGVSFVGIGDEVGINRVVTNYTFETAKRAWYDFNRDIVFAGDLFRLKTDYEYSSVTQNIDSGTMCSIVVRTDDKQSVATVEFSSSREKVNR